MTGEPMVFTTRPDGSGLYYLQELGGVSGLTYSDTMPGGPDAATMTLQYDPSLRHEAFNIGRRVGVVKGGSEVWTGSLAEPSPGDSGWTLTCDGAGTWGTRFDAVYSTYTAADILTQAIGRGLDWIVGTVTGGYLGQPADSGSQTVDDFLTQYAKTVSQTWRLTRRQAGLQADLITVPTTPTRLLVCKAPVPRTIAGYYNTIFGRYQATADNTTTNAAATYALRSAQNAASVAVHDVLETFWDLTSSGVLSAGAVDSLIASALAKYVAASYAGPFTVQRGEYLTMGGVPVDLGCEVSGEVAQLMMMDGPAGADLGPGPVTFPVGKVEYTADSDQLAVTPYQAWTGSMADLLGILAPGAPA